MSSLTLESVATPSTTAPAEVVEALYATAHWLFEVSRYPDAATVFRLMARVAPEDERSWLGLAYCHRAIDQDLIALEMLGTGRVVAAPAPRCELERARCLRALGRSDEANDAFDLALEAADLLGDDDVADVVRMERRN